MSEEEDESASSPSSQNQESPNDINVFHIFDPDEGESLLITWDGNGYDQRKHWIQADKKDSVVSLSDWE